MRNFIRILFKKEGFHKKVHILKLIWYSQKTKWWYSHFLKGCGKGNIILPPFYLSPKNIILFNNVLIFDYARIEGVEMYEGVSFDPIIILHDNVQIQQSFYLTCATKIEIGRNTSIAANVTITDIHHPYTDIHLPIEKQAIETDPVSIGEDCKLYNNVVILPGTNIGRHCTVGANSVVKGFFPDYSVIVGSPARIVKRYSFEKQAWLKTDKDGNITEL